MQRSRRIAVPWTSSCGDIGLPIPASSAPLRGDATPDSDIDLLVDLLPGGGNDLLRVAGVAEELTQLLGSRVDVVAASLLRDEVSSSALVDAVAV